jgi:hypothetical protein
MEIKVEKCFTKAQNAMLKSEIKRYVEYAAQEMAENTVHVMMEEWLKINKDWVNELVETEIEKKLVAAVKRCRIHVEGGY